MGGLLSREDSTPINNKSLQQATIEMKKTPNPKEEPPKLDGQKPRSVLRLNLWKGPSACCIVVSYVPNTKQTI
jgi:hypothetical protein